MPSKPLPTLKDLARELGLSVATVSLALRGEGNISPTTRQRVQETARALGYRPNTIAAALSSRENPDRKHAIPLAIIRRQPAPGSEVYPVEIFTRGILDRASALGYRAESFLFTQDSSKFPAFLRMLYNRGFQGLFLAPVGEFPPNLPEWNDFSVITCGRFDAPSPFHTVRNEVFESTLLALDYLRRKGCRRIGLSLVRHDVPIMDDKQRMAAAMISKSATGKRTTPFFYRGVEELLHWVRRERFDGLVGFSIEEFFLLRSAGLHIPGNLQVVALHLYDEEWNKPLSGLLPAEYACGVAAANRMDSLVRHHEKGIPEFAEHTVIKPVWREALAPAE